MLFSVAFSSGGKNEPFNMAIAPHRQRIHSAPRDAGKSLGFSNLKPLKDLSNRMGVGGASHSVDLAGGVCYV